MTIPLFKVSFKKSLKPDEEATIEFLYTILGKKKETGFPLRRAAEKELYLITDFAWLPDFFVLGKPNQFPRKYSPSWKLTLEYPSTYVAVVDGEMANRTRKEGTVIEEWRSIISQWPQILIGEYDVIKNTRGDFTLEIYCLKTEEGREAVLSADSTSDFVALLLLHGAYIIGYILAWKWEGLGGIIAIAGIICAQIINPSPLSMFAGQLLFTVPGILFLIYWFLTRGHRESLEAN